MPVARQETFVQTALTCADTTLHATPPASMFLVTQVCLHPPLIPPLAPEDERETECARIGLLLLSAPAGTFRRQPENPRQNGGAQRPREKRGYLAPIASP